DWLRTFRGYVHDMVEAVREEAARGATLEETQRRVTERLAPMYEKPFSTYGDYRPWRAGLLRNIERAYAMGGCRARRRRPSHRQRAAGRRRDGLSHRRRGARPIPHASPGWRDRRAPPLDLLPAPHARAAPGHGDRSHGAALRPAAVGRQAPAREPAAALPA